uniref:NADH dehydrogenase subunit 4L n=1 Tax=Aonchotheca putorii TaxID=1647945 RepID=UPI00237C0D27|nr:NADH dehydrogenase subunit 4L [Aonchotheca putorii]WBV76981.1 NADH dehydrogenase subunit 4L [Aonchotheca putorii]
MMELMIILVALMKMTFTSKNLLSVLISLELVNLCIISMTWQSNWSFTLWILIMSVVHSIIGFMMLLMMIRQHGNDKNMNISF